MIYPPLALCVLYLLPAFLWGLPLMLSFVPGSELQLHVCYCVRYELATTCDNSHYYYYYPKHYDSNYYYDHCQHYYSHSTGLNHTAVSRMKLTWERVPEKYTKLLADINTIMDPSRNFSRYRWGCEKLSVTIYHQLHSPRNLIKCESTRPPLIPIYPMVSKDLAFVDIGQFEILATFIWVLTW